MNTLGIIFSYTERENLRELTKRRTLSSLPRRNSVFLFKCPVKGRIVGKSHPFAELFQPNTFGNQVFRSDQPPLGDTAVKADPPLRPEGLTDLTFTDIKPPGNLRQRQLIRQMAFHIGQNLLQQGRFFHIYRTISPVLQRTAHQSH